ncbi:MAG TPA: hypothetical protein VGA99_15170 [bacterium]
MFNFTDPETFWLNVTNLGLGIVTFICCAVLAGGVLKEVVERLRARVRVPVEQDDHAFVMPQLGLTMADGGEREDKPKLEEQIESD